MAKIPLNMNTTAYHMEAVEIAPGKRREYLGMSGIGGKCLRAMWYGFHWATPRAPLPIRVKRIFDRGDLEEPRIIAELKALGMEVYREVDGGRVEHFGYPDEPQEEFVGFAGHAKGHPDGRVLGVIEAPDKPHLLEIKTAKASKFKEFVKNGVRIANQTYYGQAQRYMIEMGLDRCLFIVTNKDTEERYYERIRLEKPYAKELKRREQIIITATEPPEKLSQNRNWVDCRWCNHRGVCHDNHYPEHNCRTCDHADILDNGEWDCSLHLKKLTGEEQQKGCNHWRPGWGFQHGV